jgi:hypothetical protein
MWPLNQLYLQKGKHRPSMDVSRCILKWQLFLLLTVLKWKVDDTSCTLQQLKYIQDNFTCVNFELYMLFSQELFAVNKYKLNLTSQVNCIRDWRKNCMHNKNIVYKTLEDYKLQNIWWRHFLEDKTRSNYEFLPIEFMKTDIPIWLNIFLNVTTHETVWGLAFF